MKLYEQVLYISGIICKDKYLVEYRWDTDINDVSKHKSYYFILKLIVKVPKKIIQTKYRTLALLKNQYPRKNVYDFMNPSPIEIWSDGNKRIPNNCYFSWKTNFVANSHYSSLKKFVLSNPDFNFYFFSDFDQDEWMKTNFKGEQILDIYSRCVFGASKSDIFRICLLEKVGGIFFSINRVIELPLKYFVSDDSNYVVSFDTSKFERVGASGKIPLEFREKPVIQWGMMAPPNHGILRIAREMIISSAPYYSERRFSSPKVAIWNFDGPYMLTRAVDKYLESTGRNFVTFAGTNYFDSVSVPKGSEFRYAVEPSYLGAKNSIILRGMPETMSLKSN